MQQPLLFVLHTFLVANRLVEDGNVFCAVRESVNKSAASAASRDYLKFQAVIKSAASPASLRGGRASGQLDHVFFCKSWPLARPTICKKYTKSRTLFPCCWLLHSSQKAPTHVQSGVGHGYCKNHNSVKTKSWRKLSSQ